LEFALSSLAVVSDE
jgi:phage FluMu protein Com